MIIKFLKAIGEVSKFAWLPALIVSSASLYYAKQNFDRQSVSSKPSIVPNDSNFESSTDKGTLHIGLRNIGGGRASHIHDALYYYDNFDVKRVQVKNEDVGFDIFRDGGATINQTLTPELQSRLFLLCYTYSDDEGAVSSGSYAFRIGSEPLAGTIYPIVGVGADDSAVLTNDLVCPDHR